MKVWSKHRPYIRLYLEQGQQQLDLQRVVIDEIHGTLRRHYHQSIREGWTSMPGPQALRHIFGLHRKEYGSDGARSGVYKICKVYEMEITIEGLREAITEEKKAKKLRMSQWAAGWGI